MKSCKELSGRESPAVSHQLCEPANSSELLLQMIHLAAVGAIIRVLQHGFSYKGGTSAAPHPTLCKQEVCYHGFNE